MFSNNVATARQKRDHHMLSNNLVVMSCKRDRLEALTYLYK